MWRNKAETHASLPTIEYANLMQHQHYLVSVMPFDN